MSETKLATKADLKEMYDRMLPYLGGMPEMLANKFSKGDLYSTDEKMIGQWIDGKPLYQIVVHLSPHIKFYFNSDWQTLCPSPSNDLESLVSVKIHAVGSSNTFKDITSYINAFAYDATTQIIKGWDDSKAAKNYIFLDDIILQYTKTTDSAISIGSDTDYSTDEKVVGTWIDGKPIWQKTLQLRPTKNYPANTVTYDTLYTDESVDELISMKGTITFTYGDYTTLVLPYSSTSYQQYNFIPRWDQNQNILVMEIGLKGGSKYAPSELLFVITLQYTKTS